MTERVPTERKSRTRVLIADDSRSDASILLVPATFSNT